MFPGSPCDFDHNGECLICDCDMMSCGWVRLKRRNFKYENEEELKKMFKEFLRNYNIDEILKD